MRRFGTALKCIWRSAFARTRWGSLSLARGECPGGECPGGGMSRRGNHRECLWECPTPHIYEVRASEGHRTSGHFLSAAGVLQLWVVWHDELATGMLLKKQIELVFGLSCSFLCDSVNKVHNNSTAVLVSGHGRWDWNQPTVAQHETRYVVSLCGTGGGWRVSIKHKSIKIMLKVHNSTCTYQLRQLKE